MTGLSHPEVNTRTRDQRATTTLDHSATGQPEGMLVVATAATHTDYAQVLRGWRTERSMSTRALAKLMGYSQTAVTQVENRRQVPGDDFTRQAEKALGGDGRLWAALARLRTAVTSTPTRSDRDLRLTAFVSWLAEHSDALFGDLYQDVSSRAAQLDEEPAAVRHQRVHARRSVTRDDVAGALHERYGPDRFARATVAGGPLRLSMLTSTAWMHPTVLGSAGERIRYEPPALSTVRLDQLTLKAAVGRLARAEVDRTVMVNNPLYRLVDANPAAGLTATFTTVDFAEYALTADMLGEELVDDLVSDTYALSGRLRDRWLPDATAALAWADRVCVGGPNVLVAVARPERPGGRRDYVLFVQERSTSVVNQPGALAVIPKAFHQPVGEEAEEVALSATVQRELEEELLGRADLELLASGGARHVDPLHPQHRTAPLAWLLAHPDAFRAECLGLALNMTSGSYDYPCLFVVEDEDWWGRFGHLIEANWEADRVRRWSTLDTEGLTVLARHPRWSNEGLFALLCGLERLADVGAGDRLALPEIVVEVP